MPAEARLSRLSLSIVERRRRDRHGNLFKFRAQAQFSSAAGTQINRRAYDVYLGTR
jgi:hypothetical protein